MRINTPHPNTLGWSCIDNDTHSHTVNVIAVVRRMHMPIHPSMKDKDKDKREKEREQAYGGYPCDQRRHLARPFLFPSPSLQQKHTHTHAKKKGWVSRRMRMRVRGRRMDGWMMRIWTDVAICIDSWTCVDSKQTRTKDKNKDHIRPILPHPCKNMSNVHMQ